MASKQGYSADLKNYLDKRLRIKLNANRIVTGKLRGYDQFMNLVLEEAIQINSNNENNNNENEDLGTIMIRGNSVILWECLDLIPNK
jgi:small nuclear ribonucleoprotein G